MLLVIGGKALTWGYGGTQHTGRPGTYYHLVVSMGDTLVLRSGIHQHSQARASLSLDERLSS